MAVGGGETGAPDGSSVASATFGGGGSTDVVDSTPGA
jgi:hypothetical protein